MFQRLDQDSFLPKFRIRLAKQRQPVSCGRFPDPWKHAVKFPPPRLLPSVDRTAPEPPPARVAVRACMRPVDISAKIGKACRRRRGQRTLRTAARRVGSAAQHGAGVPVQGRGLRGEGAEPKKNCLQRAPRSANSSCSRVCVVSVPQERAEDRNPFFLAALSAWNCPRCGEKGQVSDS